MRRKGILLAGGSGSRLYPLTRVMSKQLMPVYDKPMVFYPLSTLMLAGIREVLIISTPQDLPLFKRLLGDGSQWGMTLEYAEQAHPNGIAEAFLIGRDFLGGAPCALILGDNILYSNDLGATLQRANQMQTGAMIFGYTVSDPERYGVIEFDADGRVVDLREKPDDPKSNQVAVGLYLYDETVCDYAAALAPSARGELEITDINLRYLREGSLHVELLGRGSAWLDAGTHESLLEASEFIRIVEHRQGLKIGCIEEIAYRLGFIDAAQLQTLAEPLAKTGYGQYLLRILAERPMYGTPRAAEPAVT